MDGSSQSQPDTGPCPSQEAGPISIQDAGPGLLQDDPQAGPYTIAYQGGTMYVYF